MSCGLLESLPLCLRMCRDDSGIWQLPGPFPRHRVSLEWAQRRLLRYESSFYALARRLTFQEWRTALQSLGVTVKPLQAPLYYYLLWKRVVRQDGGRLIWGNEERFVQRKCSLPNCGKKARVLDAGDLLLCADCAISRAKKGRAGEELHHAVFDAAKRDRADAVWALGKAQLRARRWRLV